MRLEFLVAFKGKTVLSFPRHLSSRALGSMFLPPLGKQCCSLPGESWTTHKHQATGLRFPSRPCWAHPCSSTFYQKSITASVT